MKEQFTETGSLPPGANVFRDMIIFAAFKLQVADLLRVDHFYPRIIFPVMVRVEHHDIFRGTDHQKPFVFAALNAYKNYPPYFQPCPVRFNVFLFQRA
jgi:hypothetical protein